MPVANPIFPIPPVIAGDTSTIAVPITDPYTTLPIPGTGCTATLVYTLANGGIQVRPMSYINPVTSIDDTLAGIPYYTLALGETQTIPPSTEQVTLDGQVEIRNGGNLITTQEITMPVNPA